MVVVAKPTARRRPLTRTALSFLEAPFFGKDGVMPAPRKYPAELRDRAVRLVFEIREESGEKRGAIGKVAIQLGLNVETLRNWVNQAEVDQGRRTGLTTDERRRMRELEKENKELRRANEILKSAAIFFGAELDRRQPK
jgi:transposase